MIEARTDAASRASGLSAPPSNRRKNRLRLGPTTTGRRIVAAHGLGAVSTETRDLVVDVRLPEPGAGRADTYEGDGYVIVRHPDTEVVERAVSELVSTIRLDTDEE